MRHADARPPRIDAFAALLGIEVVGYGDGRAEARVVVAEDHLNPHSTTHGAFLYSLAGAALAGAANDAEHGGVVSAVHIDYLRPSGAGDTLVATADVAERLPREDLFRIHVVRSADDEIVAALAAGPPAEGAGPSRKRCHRACSCDVRPGPVVCHTHGISGPRMCTASTITTYNVTTPRTLLTRETQAAWRSVAPRAQRGPNCPYY